MRKFIICLICLSSIVLISCSQNPGDVLLNIKKQHNSGNYDNMNEYYTKGTIKAMNELEKLSLKNRSGKPNEDKKFAGGTDWDIVSEKIDGGSAEIKIKYTKHPVENMKGLELTFKLHKEDGKWKIDMEKELGLSLELMKFADKTGRNGKAYYLNKNKQPIKPTED